ncbi:MAG: hypothetical protein JNK29_05995, partial [Anaerolineales bacterium]|nr:hypothetical protein [Anaerolineales bacterium]
MTGNLTAPPGLRQFAGLTCASASVLALQVIFTRIFSIMIWYHFTYLVIGVALLGGGAAGTFLAVRGWEPAVLRRRLGGLAVAFSLSILAALLLISLVHFDPLGGRQALPATAAGLALYFVALFAIYFLGGLVVSGVFSLWSGQAHRLYFADLLGGGLATVAVVGVVQALTGPGAIVLTALLALAAGALLEANLTGGRRALLAGLAAGQAALLVYLVFNPLLLPVP